MRWNRGNARTQTLRIPGPLEIKATVTEHAETVVAEIKVNHETVRKWGTTTEPGTVESVKRKIEGMLNEAAKGIWEG